MIELPSHFLINENLYSLMCDIKLFCFNILGEEKEIELKMCACDLCSKLVALLRVRHLLHSHCDKFESMEFGLLILLRVETFSNVFRFCKHDLKSMF